jgi:hypothetical protein
LQRPQQAQRENEQSERRNGTRGEIAAPKLLKLTLQRQLQEERGNQNGA